MPNEKKVSRRQEPKAAATTPEMKPEVVEAPEVDALEVDMPEDFDNMIDEAFPDIEVTDADLLPEKAGAAANGQGAHYETVSVDVDSPSGMLALHDAFKPKYYPTASTDPLTIYLSHIRNHPILDAESQQKLAVRYKEKNDLEAAQMLVLTNLRLVVKIAREYKRRC